MDADDATVLAAVAAGDGTAAEVLLRRYGPLVRCACQRQIAGADADDAAQAVFLVLWRRSHDPAVAANLPGWLVVTARQVCATARRATIRRRRHERAVALMGSGTDGNKDGEARSLLDQALAALPDAERDIVVRRHLLGEAPEAVAAVVGCAVGTVHSRTSRGLERLRAWYARRGIVCTGAALAALLSAEASAAEGLPPPPPDPSMAARRLAAASATPPASVIIVGTAIMLPILIAILFLVHGTAAGADAGHIRLYALGSQLWRALPVLGAPPPSIRSDGPAPADAAEIDAMSACRSWSSAQAVMARIVRKHDPAALVRAIQAGAPDAELAEVEPDPARWPEIRISMANAGGPLVPGLDGECLILVRASPAAQQALDAVISAAYARGHDALAVQLGPEGMATAMALRDAVRGLRDRDGRISPRPSWPTAVGPGRSPVICVPEERIPQRPLAMAPCVGGTLMAVSDLIYWWPDELPLVAARILRQRLDAGAEGRLHMAPRLPAAESAPGWVGEGEWASAVGEARRRASAPPVPPPGPAPAAAPATSPAQGF